MNVGHYPGTVDEVVAVESEDQLRALAEKAAELSPSHVNLIQDRCDGLIQDRGVAD